MNLCLKKIFLFSFLFFLLMPFFIEAIRFGPPFELPTFKELINAIGDFIFLAAIVIAPLMIIVAAFYFLTSGGDPEKVRTAKRIIFYTIVGLIIILLARGLPGIIEQIIVGPGPPPSICDQLKTRIDASFFTECGDLNYDPVADVNKDGKVNGYDRVLLDKCLNEACCQGLWDETDPCPPPPPPAEICDNNIDDDGDTLIDCDDADCIGDPACPCPPNICQDLFDLVKSLFGLSCGDPGYDSIVDVNKDKIINILDVGSIGSICGDAAACQAVWNNTFDPCLAVNLPPVASFSKSATTVIVGESIDFDASISFDPDGIIVSYDWNYGDGNTDTGMTISHSWVAAGNYTVTLTVTDNDGASDSTSSSITVNPAPALIASITSPSDSQIFLQGTSITFIGSAAGGVPPYTYSWTSSIDGIIGSTLTFNKSDLSVGVHTITFQVTDSAPIPVTDSDAITITITNDTTPPTIQNAQVNPDSGPPGTIFTITADITDPLGVDPATTKAHIQKPDGNDIAVVTLFDDGAHSDGAANDGTYGGSWDSTGFPSGAYYVDITACDLIGNCGEEGNI